MVKFKTQKIKQEWYNFALPPVKAIVMAIDDYCHHNMVFEDVIVTCIKSDKGAHAYGCAIDIRAKNNYFQSEERENRIKKFADKWFPQPGKDTLIWHSGKTHEGEIIRDRTKTNYHGHIQTATYLLRR